MEKQIEMNIPVIFQTLEKFNNGDIRFEKVKIWLMHTGLNLNGSIFEKDVVEKSIPSLANTPILAFIEENSDGDLDFSDHRMVLHRKEDGEVTLKYLGQAIGLIPETNNAHWEKRVTDNGEEKEYLVVDGLIWTKWDEPLAVLKERGLVSQSMELSENYSGHWNKQGQFVFDSFQFFGACLLGKETLPAMKNSTAELQFSQNENLHKYIEEKLTEFNSMFSDKGGQTEMEQVNQETIETTEDVLVEETQVEEVQGAETVEENFEQTEEVVDETVESTETETTEEVVDEEVTEEFTTETTEEVTETVDESQVQFSISNMELMKLIKAELDKLKTQDNWGDTYRKYWLVDFTDSQLIVEDVQNGWVLASIGYSLNGDTIVIDEESYKRVRIEYVPLNETETEFKLINERYENLKESVDKDVAELKEFKRNTLENELASKFVGQLSQDELKDVFTNSKEKSLEDVEKELFALVGKKNFSMSKPESTKIKVAFSIGEEKEPNPYGDFFK